MAFKMKGSPLHSGTSSHKSALKGLPKPKPKKMEPLAPATIPQQNGNDPFTRSIVRDIVHTKPGTRRDAADRMNQQRIKDRTILKKSDSPVKHAGHGEGIGMKHHKGRAQEFDIEKQVANDGATGKRYGHKVYGEEGSRLRKISTKLAKAKKKKSVKAYNPGRYGATRSGERWSPGSLIRKNRVKNLQKRVDRMDRGGGNSERGRNPTRSPEFWAEKARQDAIRKENQE